MRFGQKSIGLAKYYGTTNAFSKYNGHFRHFSRVRYGKSGKSVKDGLRLPSFSYRTESIGERRDFREHGGELLDQRQQPLIGHCWDEVVEHAALPE